MAEFQTISLQDQGPVRIITMNQPEAFNPLDPVSGDELSRALQITGADKKIRAVVLTGAGRAFTGGGNVREMKRLLDEGLPTAPWFQEVVFHLNRIILGLRRLPQPVVAAVNGPAAGAGVGYVMACDLVVASDKSRFDPAYIRIAASPDGGTTFFAPRLMGLQRAGEMFLLGRVISAQEAVEWGLANKVAPHDKLMDQALDWARKLAEGPAEAIAATKVLLNQGVYQGLEDALAAEGRRIAELSEKPDFAEGIQAFFAKRAPNFQ